MPIISIDADELVQTCLVCGADHTIPLGRGLSKSRKGPYALADGDTLEVKVDDETESQTITFTAADFDDIGAAQVAEVVAQISASLVGAIVDEDAAAIRIVSVSSTIETSAVEISGGTARRKLGFAERRQGPLVLGVTKGEGPFKQTAVDTIDLPHCPDCGSKECLVRTWDVTPPGFEDTFHGIHRRVVNALAEHLKATGFSDPDARPMHDDEPGPPPDIVPDFLQDFIELPRPPAPVNAPGVPVEP